MPRDELRVLRASRQRHLDALCRRARHIFEPAGKLKLTPAEVDRIRERIVSMLNARAAFDGAARRIATTEGLALSSAQIAVRKRHPELVEAICQVEEPWAGEPEVVFAVEVFELARQAIEATDPETMTWLDSLVAQWATALPDPRIVGNRSTGGGALKRLPGIWQRVLKLVQANPKITTGKVWETFPTEDEAGANTLIYRRGDELVELDTVEIDETHGYTKTDAITYNSLRSYLKAARKELGIKNLSQDAAKRELLSTK